MTYLVNYTFAVRKSQTSHFHKDTYVLNEDGKFVWLQRQAFKLLAKLGARGHTTYDNTVKVVTVTHRDVLDAVHHQMCEIMKQNRAPRHVYLGREWMDKFMREIYEVTTFTMHTPDKVFGLPVTCVPYFSGILVTTE